jgi:hypothetical protein
MALTKIDDRGLKTPIDLLDNEKIRFGTGNDLEIYHDGSNSYIKDAGTGNLLIDQSTANVLYLRSDDLRLSTWTGTETYIDCNVNGSVELYYDNAKKFETTNTGVNVTGVHVDDGATHDGDVSLNGASYNAWWDKSDSAFKFDDNAKIKVGTGGDLEIYHDGSNSYIHEGGTGGLYIRGSILGWRDAGNSNQSWINANSGAGVELYFNGTKKFETYSGGTNIPDGAAYTAGDSNDVQLYHSGGHGYLSNNTGTYYIRSNVIAIQNNGGDHNYLTIANEAGVSLYYDDVKKLETDSGGVTVSGNVTVSDGNGINFGATSQAGGATSELFADYEEGSFTPTLSGGGTSISYSEQYGYYRKIGKTVFVSVRMQFSCTTNSALFSVGGFPFTAAAAGGANYTSGGITYCNVPLDSADFDPYIGNNVTYMSFYEKVTGNSVVLSSNANNNYIGVGAFFFTDS